MTSRIFSILVTITLLAAGAEKGTPRQGRSSTAQPAAVQSETGSTLCETADCSGSVPEGYEYWKTVKARVTAYEPSSRCCGRFADGKTSTGRNAWRVDGCAADPKAIPYGMVVHIPGVGMRTVDDTGPGMRKSWSRGIYHIDVRMKYYYKARQWGSQNLDIKLYRKKA